MNDLPQSKISVRDGFWTPRLERNATVSIFQQWEWLERTGCIENFRLAAGEKAGFREGYFFADSDAYRWLDAASRIYASYPSDRLKGLMDGLVALLGRAQEEDGYLYTYNQLHFPGVRWHNLQIEHELYCHGHLIEAGVSHFAATGERSMLDIAVKAADLLVREFSEAGPESTPGHEEVEIALARLYEVTGNRSYLNLAVHFVEQRGRMGLFFYRLLREYVSHLRRERRVKKAWKAYVRAHPEHLERFRLPEENVAPRPWYAPFRWYLDTLSGKYFQQHKPVSEQRWAEGHAVRFLYLETAVAMLQRIRGGGRPAAPLAEAWEHMVTKRMYVTGGLGSNPATEGFGADYELDPWYAYAESCAAVGSIFWNREMLRLTREARYADLIEWQLYNAALVGMGEGGASYFYNNPLASDGRFGRKPWYRCSCCPSNLSRMFADLGRYVYGWDDESLWVHQYVGNASEVPGFGVVRMWSGFPWRGEMEIVLTPPSPREFALKLRVPGWSGPPRITVNGSSVDVPSSKRTFPATASGYDPRYGRYVSIRRRWVAGDVVKATFPMDIRVRTTHPRVKATRGMVAVSRGPLVYCLESVDNPGVDVFGVRLDPESLRAEFDEGLFGGTVVLRGRSTDGLPLTFIPYFLWGNRGNSKMTVYVRV